MQTWLVHMRAPYRVFRELGIGGFLTFQLIVGGNALVALAHPVFLVLLVHAIVAAAWRGCDAASVMQAGLYFSTATTGYSMSAWLAWRGLSHRNVQKKFRVLTYTPAHWLLLSIAAWRAAFELIWKPYFWNKTQHGLDNCARSGSVSAALLELERHLSDLKRRGELPPIWGGLRDSAGDRPRPLLAAA